MLCRLAALEIRAECVEHRLVRESWLSITSRSSRSDSERCCTGGLPWTGGTGWRALEIPTEINAEIAVIIAGHIPGQSGTQPSENVIIVLVENVFDKKGCIPTLIVRN
jgi:anti-sigma-K factor RskA